MIRRWTIPGTTLASALVAGAWLAHAQAPVAVKESETTPAPVVTLGSPMLKTTADRMNLPWLFSEKLPDFRLKVERPEEWGAVSVTGLESQIRGVEIRLPLNGVWVGYELPGADELPRATFSIQRGF